MDSESIRTKIITLAKSQLEKPYRYGQEVNLDDDNPPALDCSEFVEWAYHKAGLKIPDGSSNQYDFCISTDNPLPGDLGFFKESRPENDAKRAIGVIYHVGIFFDNIRVIEARGKPYDKVTFRPVSAWREFPNFTGWRRHPEL